MKIHRCRKARTTVLGARKGSVKLVNPKTMEQGNPTDPSVRLTFGLEPVWLYETLIGSSLRSRNHASSAGANGSSFEKSYSIGQRIQSRSTERYWQRYILTFLPPLNTHTPEWVIERLPIVGSWNMVSRYCGSLVIPCRG